MKGDFLYGNDHDKPDWGCLFSEVKVLPGLEKYFVCHVKVSDLAKIAHELSTAVMDTSWVMKLDHGARRAYEKTVSTTANQLVEIFKNHLTPEDKVSSEFGEILVSMGSSRALEVIFGHLSLPISELWKAQKKQNEGFDFHTVCTGNLINFGEAKFLSDGNPHNSALKQANDFFGDNKHLHDYVHLNNIVEKSAIDNLNGDAFGAVVAFSINAKNPLLVFKNAVLAACTHPNLAKAQSVYIVGVSHVS